MKVWSAKRINHIDVGFRNDQVAWNKKGSVRIVLSISQADCEDSQWWGEKESYARILPGLWDPLKL